MEYGIVANVIQDKALRCGAKVTIQHWHGSFDSAQVLGMSKGGRVVSKYIPFKRLENFRAAWIPEHIRGRCVFLYPDKEAASHSANALASYWAGVRSFKPDGSLIRDGISESEAARRAKAFSESKTSAI